MQRAYPGIFQIMVMGLGFCCLAVLSPRRAEADGRVPQQVIETFLKTLQSMEFPIKDDSRHNQLVAEANASLDLEAMGRRALDTHWDEATSDQQKTFLDLLWKLIEHVAYPRSRDFLGDHEITYPAVHEARDGFEVHSVVKQKEEALDVRVIYHLRQEDARWKIDDVILDDVSITEDLKYQFAKILAQSHFSGLLDKMRERLAGAQKETGGVRA